MSEYITKSKINNVKDDLLRMHRTIEQNIKPNLRDSWTGTEASDFTEHLNLIEKDIKRLMDKCDELTNHVNTVVRLRKEKERLEQEKLEKERLEKEELERKKLEQEEEKNESDN